MIIALKGPAQCGKSILAGMLEKELSLRGYNVKRTAFGDFVREEIFEYLQTHQASSNVINPDAPGIMNRIEFEIYNVVHAIRTTNWHTDPFMGEVRKATGNPNACFSWQLFLTHRPAHPLSRQIQQVWGQDFRRAQDPLYWIKKSFVANAEFILGSGNNILIEESCRQENEGHYVQALGGIVLDLKPLPSPTESEGAAMSHAVEQAALRWTGDFPIFMRDYFELSDLDQSAWIRKLATDCLDHMSMPMVALPSER